jgi:5-(carboxyamino)imidazole ribonucleotide synthase
VIVGVLGGGQLGRMLAIAGHPLGIHVRCLDPSPTAPADRVAERLVGRYDDPQVLAKLADGADVITYEFENVPAETARMLARRIAVWPPTAALEAAQDRLTEKTLFRQLEIPTPMFVPVERRTDLAAAATRVGLPALLKTRRLGYDGKGQAILRVASDADLAWQALGGAPSLVEAFVPFERELSILAVRGRDGAVHCYPPVENLHRHGILRRGLAPAPSLRPDLVARAELYTARLMDALDYVGIFALELFEQGGELMANEMAPRVHNSGHWTIEGAETSQFENHLRAILGLPLGSTHARGHSAVVNLIGSVPRIQDVLAIDGAHLHLYGKAARPGRKLGHVTITADRAEQRDARLIALSRVVDPS